MLLKRFSRLSTPLLRAQDGGGALEIGSRIYQLADGFEPILANQIVPRPASLPELLQQSA